MKPRFELVDEQDRTLPQRVQERAGQPEKLLCTCRFVGIQVEFNFPGGRLAGSKFPMIRLDPRSPHFIWRRLHRAYVLNADVRLSGQLADQLRIIFVSKLSDRERQIIKIVQPRNASESVHPSNYIHCEFSVELSRDR